MNKSIICLYVGTLSWLPIHALIEKEIDEKQPIEVVFSENTHNRISVDGGSIEKIFGDETYFQVNIDRMTGNAFVNVIRNINEKPLTLTVVTNGGQIQDLLVMSKDTPSEQLILKEEEEPESLAQINTSFQSHTIEFLNTILQGKTPLGYGERDPLTKENLQLPSPLVATPLKTMEGPYEIVVVYKIRNAGKNPVVVTPEALKTNHISWVFLNAHELAAKEEILCLISIPKKEG